MTVPPLTPYSEIPPGGVFSSDGKVFYLKSNDTLAVQMDNGGQLSNPAPTDVYIYFPSAALTL